MPLILIIVPVLQIKINLTNSQSFHKIYLSLSTIIVAQKPTLEVGGGSRLFRLKKEFGKNFFLFR